MTQTLEHQLPPDALGRLRALDARYGGYKTLQDATARAGDQHNGNFTPSQLSAAVRRSVGDTADYSRGAGGTLRELARAGRDVLEDHVPHTGERVLTHGMVGNALSPLMAIANTGPIKRALLGQTATQRYTSMLAEAIRRAGTNASPAPAIGPLASYLEGEQQ